MNHKTQFNQKAKNTYYYVVKNMMLGTDHGWNKEGDGGKGDALWRTGWAYITYKSQVFKKGILSCFVTKTDKKGKEYLQAHRFPGQGSEDVSRDQITSALAALAINGDKEDVRKIVKGLKWRISKKFRLTLDMWLWMQSISSKWWIFKFLYSLIFTLQAFIFVLPLFGIWNKILYKWAKLQEIDQDTHNALLRDPANKDRIINSKDDKRMDKAFELHYPTYAYHLFGWQVESLPWNPFKPLLKLLARLPVHKSNYGLKMLFGGKIEKDSVNEYRPMSGVRWQGNFWRGTDKDTKYILYSGTEVIEENYHFMERLKLTSEYNALDNDMIWTLGERHPKLIKDYD